MSIAQWLVQAVKELKATQIPTPRLDAEVILGYVLNKERIWVHTHLDYALNSKELHTADILLKRRASHEPIAYILGKQEFFGRDFFVSPATLTPRPETETMIELVLKDIEKKPVHTIIDIGTGSGCILITLALEIAQNSTDTQQTSFLGLDISKDALKIAKKNAQLHGAKVIFNEYDIRNESLPKCELIVANLPYVPTDFHINLAASHEPEIAIYGGNDGLDYYRLLFNKVSRFTHSVYTESLPPQHQNLASIAEVAGFNHVHTQDFIQVFTR